MEMLERGYHSGIRAQAISKEGNLVEDFCFEEIVSSGENSKLKILNVRNAPSPAATSSLLVAREIVSKAEQLSFF